MKDLSKLQKVKEFTLENDGKRLHSITLRLEDDTLSPRIGVQELNCKTYLKIQGVEVGQIMIGVKSPMFYPICGIRFRERKTNTIIDEWTGLAINKWIPANIPDGYHIIGVKVHCYATYICQLGFILRNDE